MLHAEQEEKTKIIETYSAVFLNSDAHQWNDVKSFFADTVHLDYTSGKFFRDKKEITF